jgi:hypothetical protein
MFVFLIDACRLVQFSAFVNFRCCPQTICYHRQAHHPWNTAMNAPGRLKLLALALALSSSALLHADEITDDIALEYNSYLSGLFEHFHRNPELSFQEHQTAARMALELRAAGFQVTEKIGQTGLVAILENGPGPLVAMRADMDALPVEEKSGLPYASTAKQLNPATGQQEFVAGLRP